jgi:hypothetical protein
VTQDKRGGAHSRMQIKFSDEEIILKGVLME